MSPPPLYTLLPTSPTLLDPEKAPDSIPPQLPPRVRSARARAYALALGGAVSVAVLVVFLYARPEIELLAMAGRTCGRATATSGAGLAVDLASVVEDVEGTADNLPTYSTTVFEHGDTSLFDCNTRPIIKPAGYTIDPYVGCQHISSPTTVAPSPTSTDSHRRQKRGFDLEDDAGPSTELTQDSIPFPHTDGSTEFSYARERNGEVGRYVKTTRPIVNPVGFTIGSLDGAYIRVGTHKPTSTPSPRVVELWRHQELRRRDLVEA